MNAIKKGIVGIITAAMFTLSTSAEAANGNTTSGYGYQQATRSATLGPALALGTIALIAIIAILLNNSSSHDHS